MASTPDQRQRDERAAFSARFGMPRIHVLAVAALVVAAVTASSVVLAQLAGWRTPEQPATPGFLATALGAPQADAPLVREPAAGVVLAADDESLTFRHGRSTLALRSEHGSGTWWRFARGAARPTAFGSQTVVYRGERGLEDYLRVERRLGTRTWRWQLDTDATPSLRDDGTVWFTNGTADAGFHIAPVEISDDRGRDITPDGLRWTLARREGAWSLELRLDDRSLPVPYVIDPAIAVNGANTANGATPLAPARPGASGDLLIAHVFVRGTGTITAPAGWTQIQNSASTNVRQATYWVISDGTNGTSFSWTGGTNAGVAVIAYTNPHPTSPIQASTTNTGTGTTATATGVTTTHPGESIATFFGQATNTAVAAPTGFTQDYTAVQSGGQAGRLAITGASAAQASAGASGDKTTTAAAEWMAQLVAIRQRPDDGSGSISTTTTALPSSSTGNTITFTYTAGNQGLAGGSVAVDVPTGWSPPSLTTTTAGYTTASTGTVGVSAQRITVTGVTLAAGATMTITYGSKGSGGPGATASSTTGGVTWSALSRGSSVTGTALTALASSPSITQVAADGSGTMSVSPTTVTVGATTTLTFTYTAAAGAMSGGAVTLAVPASWTAPNTTSGTPGYTTATGGSGSNAITYASGVLTISGVTLSSGGTLTVAYGTGAGGAVTVPAGTGAQTWTTQQRSLATGTLTSLGSSPQTTKNNAPTATVSLSPASPTTNQTLTATVTRSDADGDTVTLTYVWKVNGSTVKTTSGSASITDTLDLSQAGNGDKGQTVSVEATPNDGTANGSTVSDSKVVANSAPTISSVTIDQASPKTNDTLSVTVVSADADGDSRTSAYQWRKNGVDISGATAATLNLATAGNGDKGDAISVRVTASDGTASSAASTSSAVTVQNSAPAMTSAAIDQAAPATDDTLTFTVASTDADGDARTYAYQWRRNGADIAGATNATLDLSQAGNGDKGDAITVRVTASDGTASSVPLTSAGVTVQNSAPTIASVAIDQAGPKTNDVLTVTVASADADGDARSYAYQWRRNGVDISGATSATLDLSQTGNGDKGDTITVRVTASDGSASSAPSTSAGVVVQNTAPTITSVTIDQAAPKTNDTVSVTVVSADADGDTRTHGYQWAKGGVDRLAETAAGYDLSLIGNGDRGDSITVRVVASDGTDTSAPSTSTGVSVANTAPVLSGVTIDQAAPHTNDTLTATVTATDADGDTLTPTRQWRRNGVDLAGETAAGLDLSQAGNGDKGDQLALRVSVSDGTASDGPTTSAAVTVQNAAPTITSASIDQATPHTNATLTVSVASADADGDARTFAYQWRRNGSDLAGETGSTLDLSQAGNGDKGDAISVRVAASDGSASSAPTTTTAVTVANTLPIATASLAPTSPTTSQTLTATATRADADGDSVTLSFVWKVNGVVRKTTAGSASLTDTFDLSGAGDGDEGQTVSVEVTPNDGDGDGSAATDSVTVANSAPTATVSLAPASPTTDQTLTATATKADPDGDTVTLTYVWKVNGVVRKTTPGSSSLTDTLDLSQAGNGDKGQTVSVEVTPNDGSADGSATTDAATVANAAPTLLSVAIDQGSPRTNDTLTVSVTSADADGDARTYAYQWRTGGVDIAGATTSTLDLSQAGNGDKGDAITVRVVANDGTADSAPLTSTGATVLNSAPTATVGLPVVPVGTNDTVAASATKADADGDTVTLTYVWKVNGATVQTTPGTTSLTDTLDLSQAGHGDRGDTVSVEVTPNDGSANGTAATDSVGVDNALPTATAALAPASPTTSQTLTATATKGDTDGDTVTLTYVWKVNGVVRRTTAGSSSLTDTFDLAGAGNGGRGDTVLVEVTPNDGTGDGSAVTDSTTIANGVPTATVSLSPAAPKTDELVTATATKADSDGDAVALTYVWKVDGTTVKTTSGSASLTDTLDLAQTGNGDRGQSVSVEVTPDDGTATGTAATDAATVANSAPVLLSVSIDQASPRTNDTLSVSLTASDADGDTLTPARQWRRNGGDLAGESGATLDLAEAANGDRGDQLALRLSLSDGSASSATLTSAAVTVANSAPTVVSATIDEASPLTNSALTVTVVSSDADGDTRTNAYQWTKNGVDRFGETASGYDLSLLGNGDRGDQVAVRVVASDGTDTSAPATSAAVTVANSAPVVDSVSIDQGAPRTNDSLTQSVSGHDDDGDTVTWAYQWRRNGTDLTGETGGSLDLARAGNGDEGDQLAVRVVGSDGTSLSAPLTSTAVAVVNTAPTAAVSVAPASPTTNQTLTATATKADVDGDTVTLTYVWKVNGVVRKTTAGSSSPTDTFDLSGTGDGDRGQTVSVEITPDDGDEAGSPVSDSATVANSAPTLTSVAIDQASPATDDTLTVSVTSADADGDARTLAYQWRRNGVDLAGETGATLDLAGAANGDKGDAITVRVTANDGTATSAPSTSAAVTVANAAPAITSVAIDEAAPRTNDLLSATVVSSDADGDARTYAYQWRLNGVDLTGETGATLDLSQAGNGDKGDAISVRVTASDGSASSAPTTSAAVTVLNTAPTITSVAIDQAAPRTNDTLTATDAATDADGDTLTTARQWRRNGTDLAGETAAALDLSDPGNGDKGDQLTLRVSVDDGTASSASSTSAAVTVQNTAPTCSPTLLATTEGTPADVSPVCTDADGDALTPAIASQGTRGVASVAAGQLHYDPSPGESGSDLFAYRAGDGTDLSAPAAVAVTIADVTPPETTIDSGPAQGSVATTVGATFAFSADAPATFECRLDGGSWAACTSPLVLSGLAEGAHTLEVRASDGTANTDPTPATRSWTIDTQAPETTLGTMPDDPSNDATPSFTFLSEPGATFEARLDGGAWAPATSPLALAPLADGGHTLEVRAVDAAGNADASPSLYAWDVDTVAPSVTLDDPGANLSGTVTLTATASDADSGIASVVFQRSPANAGTWTTIAASWDTSAGADGLYDLRAIATDGAGNATTSTLVEDRLVDNVSPDTTLDAAPADPDNDATPTLAFSSSETGSTFECRIDGGGWSSCSSPLTTATLPDGARTFEVRAIDASANPDPTPDSHAWVLDTIAPAGGSITVADGWDTDGSVAITTDNGTDAGGSGVASASAVVEREAATLTTGSCGTFDAAWSAVTIPDASVAGGACYRYRLRVRDNAGNWAMFTSASVVKVDLTAPAVPSLTVANVSGTQVAGTTAYFQPGTSGSFTVTPTSTDPESGGVTFSNPNLGTGWSRVGTTWSFDATAGDPNEPNNVTATNAAGLTSAGASFTVTADAAPPVTTAAAAPAANGLDWHTSTPVSVTLSAADAGAGVKEIRYTTDGSTPGPTSPLYAAPIDVVTPGTATLTFRAEDNVGNLETPSTVLVRIDTTAPTTPTLAYSGFANASFDGTVVWFRPGAAGGFTVTPSASDLESGVASHAFPALGGGWSSTGGGAYAFTATSADPVEPNDVVTTNGAGLTSAGAPITVTADSTAPVSTATCDAAVCSAGWYTAKPITVVLTASDVQSGLDRIDWSTDGSAPANEYLGPLSLGAEGTTTVSFAARDEVGNVETAVSQDVRIDTVAPAAAMGAVAPYLRGTVALTSTQSDATSGVGSVQFQIAPTGTGTWTNVPASWDTTATANGQFDVRVRVTDVAGNVTDSTPVASVWVDNLAPAIALDPPASPASGSVLLTSTTDDVHSGLDTVEHEYSAAGANDWQTTALTGALWDTTQLADGDYDLRARATDRSGNLSGWSVVAGIAVDNSPPTVSVTAPLDGSYVNAVDADPFTLAASATDAGTGVASVEFLACATAGPTCSSWTSVDLDTSAAYTGSWALPGDGERQVKAVATDNAGHTAEAVVTLTVDRTAPSASLTAPTAGANVRGTVALTATSADATSGVASVDFQRSPAGASSWTTIPASWDTTGVADGLYDLRVLVTDGAGNTRTDVAANVRVDNTAPTGALTDPGQYFRGSFALIGSAADAGSGVASVEFQRSPEGAGTWTTIDTDTNGGDGWSATFDTNGGGTPDGPYDLRVVVTDNAGNTSAHALSGRTVDNTSPSAAIADPGANLRLTVTLGGTAADTTSGVANVTFEYDNGGGWQLISTDGDGSDGWSASLNTTLPATPDGLYAFRLTATDRAGNQQTSQITGRRIDNTAPTASFTNPGPYLMGAVQLTASATDGGSGIDAVRFERSAAGSGGPWTQVGPDASFAAGAWRSTWNTSPDGLYDLRVVVDDDAGNRTIDTVASRRVDNTAPVTTDDAAPGRHNTNQTITLSRSDAGSGPSTTQYRVRTPGGSFGSWLTGTSVTILASGGDGVYTIEYFSTDAAGNVESVKSTDVLIDTTGPSGTVTDPSTYLRGLVTLTATAGDPADVSSVRFEYAPEGTAAWTQIGTDLTANGSDEYTVDWDTTGVADIAYDLQVTFIDSVGNPTVRSLTGKTVDNELPAIALTAPPAGSVRRNVIAITANAADGVSGMREVRFEVKPAGAAGFSQVDVDNGSSPYSSAWDSTGSADGPTDLRVIAVDQAGNMRSATTTIFVDNNAPTLTVSAPSTAVSGTVTLTATGSSDIQSVVFKVGGSTIGTDNDGSDGFSTAWSTVADGNQVVTAEATDVGGNVGTSAPVTVQVDNTAPFGAMTLPANGATISGTVALTASASDAGSGVSGTSFQFKRTSDSTWTAIGGSSWDTTAVATGAYNLRARVTDNAGNSTLTAAITVQVVAPAVVTPTPPTPPAAAPAAPAPSNPAPSVLASDPADGSVLTASPGSIDVTASERLAAVTGLTLNGSAVRATIAGSGFSVDLDELPTGAYTLAGTLVDASGKSAPFRIHFTVVLGSPTALPYVEANAPADAATSLTAVDGASVVTVPAGAVRGGADWLVVRIQPLPASSVARPRGGAPTSVVGVSAHWAIAGTEVHSFLEPLEIVLPGASAARVPATLEDGRWRVLEPVRGGKALPVDSLDGYVRTGDRAHILTRHLSVFALIPAPAPPRLVMRVTAAKTLSWSTRAYVAARVKVSRAANLTATLVGPRGTRLRVWHRRVEAGASVLRLPLPGTARTAGAYRIVVTASAGGRTVRRTLALQVVRNDEPQRTPGPTEVALAADVRTRRTLALGFRGTGMRLVAADADGAFALAARGDVRVVLVDVDRHGTALVRDLNAVFPSLRLLALASRTADVRASRRAGADAALPRSASAARIARVLRRLAR